MQIETPEVALFRSVNAALAFACNFKHGAVKASGMAMMYRTPPGLDNEPPKSPPRGLGGLDGAGTAGMILAEVEALQPRLRGHILVARFAVRALPCSCGKSCCSGWRANGEWLQALSAISDQVRADALAGCSVNYLLRHTLVKRYFGVRVGLSDAANAAGVDRDTASAHASRVIGYLKDHERLAQYAIEGKLKAAGIVE